MKGPFTRTLQCMVAVQLTKTSNAMLAATSQKPPPSFFKRVLPETCVAFSSPAGKRIFASALHNGGLKSYFALIQQYTTQLEPAYCGLTTLVVTLNALSVDPLINWKGPWRWYSEELLNCCLSLEEIKTSGITLMDFASLARCQGLTVEVNYPEGDDGLAKFRQAVQEACVESTTCSYCDSEDSSPQEQIHWEERVEKVLAVSYSRKVLNQTGTGHFSPIAAYDPESDQVLILDTARFKYGAHWTKLELLYEAMKPIDEATGKSRGYALLSFSNDKFRKCPGSGRSKQVIVQPMSLLFLTKLSQSPARKQYKNFLKTLNQSVTLDAVFDYWTKTPDTAIWDILEPLPVEETQRESVDALHRLIEDLWKRVDADHEAHFKELQSTQYDGKTGEGQTNLVDSIFVVFLASLDEKSRFKLVQQANDGNTVHSELSIEQLLNEAALIATAIETSDQNDTGCISPRCTSNV